MSVLSAGPAVPGPCHCEILPRLSCQEAFFMVNTCFSQNPPSHTCISCPILPMWLCQQWYEISPSWLLHIESANMLTAEPYSCTQPTFSSGCVSVLIWANHSDPFSTEAAMPLSWLSSWGCQQTSYKCPLTISQVGLLASSCTEALFVFSPALSPFYSFLIKCTMFREPSQLCVHFAH